MGHRDNKELEQQQQQQQQQQHRCFYSFPILD